MNACKICGNEKENATFIAEEKMFGLKDKFEYLTCSSCACIQVVATPPNLGDYYPPTKYYSFKKHENRSVSGKSVGQYLRKLKADYLIKGSNKIVGKLLSINYAVPDYYKWLKKIGATYDASILDVGCGGGELLHTLKKVGFKYLFGTDPFIGEEINEGGITIYKKELFELETKYDIIFMVHAFEHMESPLEVLRKSYTLLNSNSYLIIQIPIAESAYWEMYGINWVHLDAPRHLYIHSAKSIRKLVEQTEFALIDIVHDGTAFQFLGSEQYLKDISLTAPNSYFVDKKKSIFTKKDVKNFQQKAENLNKQNLGGQATIYLYKK